MAQLLRVSIKGSMPGGEDWSVNPVWTISDFGVSTTPVQIQAVATALAAVNPPASALAFMNSATTLHTYRVEARTSAGVLENLAEAVRGAPLAGNGATPHPYQTSAVVSLRTNQVGASGRGRLYFPATGVPLQAGSLRPSSADVTAWIGGIKTYLSGMQTAVRTVFPTASLIVWSRKTTGMFPVDTIQAGDVLDTQRRRRDTLIEAYQSVAFP